MEQSTLLILKLFNVVNFSWWIVFAPTLVALGLWIICVIVVLILKDKKR